MSEEPLAELATLSIGPRILDRALERWRHRRSARRQLTAAVLVSLAVGVVGGWLTAPTHPVPPVAAHAHAERLTTRFVLHAPEAERVTVVGSFNGWNAEALPMVRGPDGVFYAIVRLPRGRHEYLFVVDGEWRMDPAAPLSVDDGFGSRNAVLEV